MKLEIRCLTGTNPTSWRDQMTFPISIRMSKKEIHAPPPLGCCLWPAGNVHHRRMLRTTAAEDTMGQDLRHSPHCGGKDAKHSPIGPRSCEIHTIHGKQLATKIPTEQANYKSENLKPRSKPNKNETQQKTTLYQPHKSLKVDHTSSEMHTCIGILKMSKLPKSRIDNAWRLRRPNGKVADFQDMTTPTDHAPTKHAHKFPTWQTKWKWNKKPPN